MSIWREGEAIPNINAKNYLGKVLLSIIQIERDPIWIVRTLRIFILSGRHHFAIFSWRTTNRYVVLIGYCSSTKNTVVSLIKASEVRREAQPGNCLSACGRFLYVLNSIVEGIDCIRSTYKVLTGVLGQIFERLRELRLQMLRLFHEPKSFVKFDNFLIKLRFLVDVTQVDYCN